MTLDEAGRAEAIGRMRAAGVASPEADLRTIERVAAERGLGPDDLDRWVARRADREPLQLILGVTWFRNVEVVCEPGVFIPRPETEVVAGLAIAAAGKAWPNPLVVEPCTGTGAITCALVTEVPGVQVIATEVHPPAARLATRNVASALAGAAGHPVAEGATAEVRGGSLLLPVDDALRGHLDVLVANPPYLPAEDIGSWDREVAEHDNVLALVGGQHGNEVVEELLESASRWLKRGGVVVLELDPRLAGPAVVHARALGLVDVEVHADLTGRDRALVAHRPR